MCRLMKVRFAVLDMDFKRRLKILSILYHKKDDVYTRPCH